MSHNPPTSLMDDAERIPSWSFKDKAIGTVYAGTVESTDWMQQTDYDTQKPLWWNPGEDRPSATKLDGAEPVWQYVVTLQTEERLDAEDDGKRRDFVKRGKGGTRDLQQAVKDAGLDDLKRGCKYLKKLTGEEPSSNPRHNARKVYAWKVEAPVASLNDFETSTPSSSQPAQQPVAAASDF